MNGGAPEAFAAYIDAFNREDYAAFGRYYTDDVVLVIAGSRELRGKQAIFDFYKDVKAKTRRTIRIIQAFCDGDGLAAELESEFLALEDLPDFQGGPLRAGDRMHINTFVLYELEGGQYARIRSATFRRSFTRATAASQRRSL
jgi:ketosteroid isomerase-like protein